MRLGSPSSPPKMVPPTQGHQNQEEARPLKIWELIPPFECWMCKGDDAEDKRMMLRREEDLEEDAPEEEMHVIHRPMDVDAGEDYLQFLEELQRHPEYFPFHSSQAFTQHPSDDSQSQSFDAHSQPSYDLSGVWPPLVGPSQ
ncbi:hypothetical protein PIB30_079733 [Stylosanthes scabra]|uniref:Uncharacterized protein n=1 Tax=Stylosanthes scabra TaxID=79078 RepID=A0ABU6WPH5_9FABA|nr:hypothetical protein [Stylosanthes scabra]